MKKVLSPEKPEGLWFYCYIENKDVILNLQRLESPVSYIICEYFDFWTTSWRKLLYLALLYGQQAEAASKSVKNVSFEGPGMAQHDQSSCTNCSAVWRLSCLQA